MINSFKRDLESGKVIESCVLDKIRTKYPKAYMIDGYCKEWDIFIPELNCGVEVKSDKMSLTTNNIVIEVEFNNKPSALTTSKAKWWVIYDGNIYNWFLVNNIKKCILQNKLKYATFTGKGDSKSKKAYLIKKELLYKYKTL